MTTDPFRNRPRSIARLPRIVRLYILHSLIGFGLAAVFTGLVLWLNIANIGYLVTHVSGGTLAAVVFFMLNGIVFSGVQTGIAIMSLGDKDDDGPRGGTSVAVTVPVEGR